MTLINNKLRTVMEAAITGCGDGDHGLILLKKKIRCICEGMVRQPLFVMPIKWSLHVQMQYLSAADRKECY